MPSPVTSVQRDSALEATLAWHIGASRLGCSIYAFRRVGSTMDIAHQLAAQGPPEGTLVFAERQERGRGRLGRPWMSPPGGSYCSLILYPKRPSAEVPQLSLVAGLAVAETISWISHLSPSIRWPNDVFVDGRKVAGVLVEAKSRAVVVGIGVNVATPPSELPESAASLEAFGICGGDPLRLTGVLCQRFEAWYDAWVAHGFAPIREALRPWIGLFGQVVRLTTGSGQVEGQVVDVDGQGRLVVRLDSGVLRAFGMGEVTLLR